MRPMRTGYRLAIGVAAITIVVAIVLFVAELLGSTRDPTAYGQVGVPGRNSVNLPAGDVIIFYGELPTVDEPFPLHVPPSLNLRIRTTNGQLLLGSTPFVTDVFTNGPYERRAIAKLRVPEAGDYEAVASAKSVYPGARPVISFGHEGTRDFGYVLFVVAGGGLLAAILGIGTMIVARLERD
jgi:hypothetical protein